MTIKTVIECDECGVHTDDLKGWIETNEGDHFCEDCSNQLQKEGVLTINEEMRKFEVIE